MNILNRKVCEHEWVENYDPAIEAECYNDGFNYLPAEYICTKMQAEETNTL